MTDREMVINLGRYIIQMQRRIKALECLITESWPNPPQSLTGVPWSEVVNRSETDEYIQRVSSAQLNGLHLAIAAETQDSALIRALHNQFLKEE
jgi:hypothetical protein